MPRIVLDSKTIQNENTFILRKSDVTVVNKKATYLLNGIRTTLHSSINSETLLTFVYQAEVNMLFYTNEHQKPLLYLKEETSDSHAFFSKTDIIRIIRYYKLVLSNYEYFESFESSSPITIPDSTFRQYAWIIAKGSFDSMYGGEPQRVENDETINHITTNPKLAVLFRLLCYVNYSSIKFGSDMRFEDAHIILLQTDELIKGTDLYDNFYVEYHGNNRD